MKQMIQRKYLAQNRNHSESVPKTGWDIVKWVPLIMSISGLFFWMAGTAYESGFWESTGSDGAFISKSFQQIALTGFIGPIRIWLISALFFLATGVVVLVTTFVFLRIKKKNPKFPSKIDSWFEGGNAPKSDDMFVPAFTIMFGGFSAIVIFLMIIFLGISYQQGQESIKQKICTARKTKVFPSTAFLNDGSKMQGIFIGRSEKLSVLLNDKGIFVITVGEKPQLVDSTNTAGINCAN